jgi:hypothetical protein
MSSQFPSRRLPSKSGQPTLVDSCLADFGPQQLQGHNSRPDADLVLTSRPPEKSVMWSVMWEPTSYTALILMGKLEGASPLSMY